MDNVRGRKCSYNIFIDDRDISKNMFHLIANVPLLTSQLEYLSRRKTLDEIFFLLGFIVGRKQELPRNYGSTMPLVNNSPF